MRTVLLHGFAGSAESWSDVLAHAGPAAEAPVSPHLFGHRGHAEEGVDEVTFGREVDRLADWLVDRNLERIHLVGYSMGSRLALGLLVRHPGLAARATLIGVQPGFSKGPARELRRREDEAWALLLEEQGIGAFADAFGAQPLFESQTRLSAPVLARQHVIRRSHDPQGLAKAMRALGVAAMPDLWPDLACVRTPVALVHGSLDAKFAALAAQISARLPSATVQAVEGSGHNPLLEQPAALAGLLFQN